MDKELYDNKREICVNVEVKVVNGDYLLHFFASELTTFMYKRFRIDIYHKFSDEDKIVREDMKCLVDCSGIKFFKVNGDALYMIGL